MGAILIEELRFPMPHGVAKKKKKKIERLTQSWMNMGKPVLLHSIGESISWWDLLETNLATCEIYNSLNPTTEIYPQKY